MTRILCFGFVLTLCSGIPLIGQELVTDRPDFTESPIAVPVCSIQFESGAEFSRHDPSSELTYPNILLRFGIVDRLEGRIGFTGWTRLQEEPDSRTRANDLAVEGKYQLTGHNAATQMAVLLVCTFPTGNPELSSGTTDIGVKLAGSADLDEVFALSANTGLIHTSVGAERRLVGLASASLGINLSDVLGGFLEGYVEIPEKASWQPMLDGGLTLLVTPLVQLDAYAGIGLNSHTPQFVIGAGCSFRIHP